MQAYKKAFTLTELMATLAIVAILAAVGIPSYLSYTKKARFSEVISATTAVKVSIEHCYNTIGSFVGCNNDKFGIPPAVVNGENAFIIISAETPAAINNDTPEPKPHLCITSSMNNISIPPKNNWNTRINCIEKNCEGINVAVGANPPMNT